MWDEVEIKLAPMGDYPSHQEMEDIKSEFSKEYKSTEKSYARGWLILHKLIWAHYWRARQFIEGRKDLTKIFNKKHFKGYQLEIDLYTENWLWSNADKWDQEAIKWIEETWHYKPKESKHLPKGCSEYQA